MEGREANLEKIRLAKDALGLANLELLHEDIRGLDADRHGEFDVVLALGVVCLLDAPDVFVMLERLHDVCRNLLVVEVNPPPVATAVRTYRAKRYHWTMFPGELRDVDPLDGEARWTSIGNSQSFRLTAPSMCNALADVGFAAVLQRHMPAVLEDDLRSITLAALKGGRAQIVSVPRFSVPAPRLDERPVSLTAATLGWATPFARALIPRELRPRIRRMVARVVGAG